MLNVLLVAAAGLLGLGVLALLALPTRTRVERTTAIEASPESIYALLSSNSGFQRFNPYCDTDPELRIELYGPQRGVGSAFRFAGKEGRGTQTITAVDENRSVTMEIDLGMMGRPTQQFLLAPSQGGTEVTWRVDMDFGLNLFGRLFGLFANSYLGKIYERGLGNLDRTLVASA
ncbi:MAG: SRPBCC family protein [Myxococcota bacterium]